MSVPEAQLLSYALAKQAPCIARQAVFGTDYGELCLDEADTREVAALVIRLLRAKLTRLDPAVRT